MQFSRLLLKNKRLAFVFLLTAFAVVSTHAKVNLNSRGHDPQLVACSNLEKPAAGSVQSFSELPLGRYEYVRTEYRLLLPSLSKKEGSIELRTEERLSPSPQGQLKITSGFVCQENLKPGQRSGIQVERMAPRFFELASDHVSAAYRGLIAGNDGGNPFYRFEELSPKLNIGRAEFIRNLSENWDSWQFEKLSQPLHFALRLKKLTPSGMSEAIVTFRNEGAEARSLLISEALVDVARSFKL